MLSLSLTTFALYNLSTHNNVSIRKTIVSEDILSKDFVCNLTAWGACCVNGDADTKSGRNNNFRRNISKGEAIPAQAELLLLRHKVLR
jgi:hypothetical protein